MKYIDAGHLKVEIEKLIKEVKDAAERFTPNMGFFHAKLSGIYDVMALIDSLQQEHPAKRGYKDCNGCEYNRPLKDQIGWQFRGCFGGDYKGKPIAEIELCPLKVADQQERPKVDLEKVVMIDNVIMNMTAEGYNNGYKTRPFYEEVLRRFNERKE